MNVALNSAAAVKQFRTTTAMMEVIDYDLADLTQRVIKHISDCNNMSELDRYCLVVLSATSTHGEFTNDGEILSRALKEYGEALRRCMAQMRLYSSSGQLLYRFQSLVSSTILLEPIG